MPPPPPPPPPPPEHSTSAQPLSAAKRASTSPTARSTKSHKAPPERKKRKTLPTPPPPELTPAKTSDATETGSTKKLALAAPCHAGGKGVAQAKSAGHQSGEDAPAHKAKTLDEMSEMYPHLVDEAMALVDPAVLERVLPRIDNNEAQALEKKVKRARRHFTDAVMKSAKIKNMETSTVFRCQATRLQLEKSRMDKEDGVDICTQERLARVERDIVELRQIVIDSNYQATIESNPLHDNSSTKGVRCRSEESHPQLAVAENQIPHNILQKKIEVSNGCPHKNDEEVTSKYKHDGVIPRRIPPDYLGRTRNIDMESQTAPNMDGKEVVLLSMVWPHTPVGKGIIQSSSPSTIVGGIPIGTSCRKVFVSEVLKRNAPLFWENRDMKKMFDALKCSIAWPDSLIRR